MVSVIVPAHQAGEELHSCLEHLQAAKPGPLEILVVADGCPKVVEQANAMGLKALLCESRQGPASARNLGAAVAQGEILLFVDSDVAVPPEMIGKVQRRMEGLPHISGLFGSYDAFPAKANFFSQYRNLLHHFTHQTSSLEASTFWGGFGAVRRDVFLALSGFDAQRYSRPSIEDIEFGFRLKQAQHQILLCPDFQVQHLKRWTALDMLHTDIFRRALPWTHLLLGTNHWVNELNLSKKNRVGVFLAMLAATALPVAVLWPILLWGIVSILFAVFILHQDVYHFFLTQRGPLFSLQAMIWHWIHLWCCGFGFLAGWLSHTLAKNPFHQGIRKNAL